MTAAGATDRAADPGSDVDGDDRGALCGACGEAGEPGDRFCEACGAPLAETAGPPPERRPGTRARPVTARVGPAVPEDTDGRSPTAGDETPHAACGEGTIADGAADEAAERAADEAAGRAAGDGGDGGPAGDDLAAGTVPADAREHAEHAVPGAAAITDLGRVRAANEDAYGLARLPLAGDAGELVVGVVCDGVASVPGSEAASLAACTAVLDAAHDALAHPDVDDPDLTATGGVDLTELAHVCADAATDAVAALAVGRDAPACTYVSALVVDEILVISWIGDSRAYWLVPDDPEESVVLTTDDSWAAEAVAIGLLDAEAAYADPRAHAITRWVAADGPPGPAHVVAHAADRPGKVLICSDGLWNHVPVPADLARLVADRPADTATAMLHAALDDGGTDNTTLVVVDVAVPERDTP
ncbi:PP2C family serine/threonine-protein phosphatase [Actinomycetospora soli]|uniref:PP2C family serine/threonine-protein phosphatase n=1 Tax=Actinomycetospora soli TaxID=2893887 RepID=UPI001E61376F|nr:PP2C family serine/threonine-protein phosphatase [Actinomycetospora soli]MCD2185910.1 protein phosphatase 2C domain-containing protein [Actinomycetospora soli]